MANIKEQIQKLTNQQLPENEVLKRVFQFLDLELYGISILNLILIVLCVLVTIKLVRFLKQTFLKHLEAFALKRGLKIVSLLLVNVEKIGNPFYITLTLFLVCSSFGLVSLTQILFYPAFIIVCGFYSISIIKTALLWLVTQSLDNPDSEDEDKKDEAFIQMVSILISAVTYILVFLVVGQILKWDLSLIVGGLGVSSIAIAFAIQNVLSDIFAAFTIFIDQPFKPGDQIILSNYTGTVKKIGLKSTRISLLDGDELIVSNQDLTSSRVRNLRKIRVRRVSVTLELANTISFDKLKQASMIVTEAINTTEHSKFKRISFTKISPKARDLEYVYLIDDQQYDMYCEIQEEINYKIIQEFANKQIPLAIGT
jgi:small-conductance mechanosensitive channel